MMSNARNNSSLSLSSPTPFLIIAVKDLFDANLHQLPSNITRQDDFLSILATISSSSSNQLPVYTIHETSCTIIKNGLPNFNYHLVPVFNALPNTFVACGQECYEEKCRVYMQNAQMYSIVKAHQQRHDNDNNIDMNEITMKFIYDNIKKDLDDLNENHYLDAIPSFVLNIKSFYHHNLLEFGNLQLRPDLCQHDIPLRPFIASSLSTSNPTSNLSQYLHNLIGPIYYKQMSKENLLSKKYDVLNALQSYQDQGLLSSRTLFGSIVIPNLSELLTYEHAMQVLEKFLCNYANENNTSMTINNIPIQAILKLTRFLLSHQYFKYDDKIFRQTAGASSHMPFTILLTNIYMYYWQKNFVRVLQNQKEIFARSFHEMFFTWKKSKQDLIHLIQTSFHQKEFPESTFRSTIGVNVTYTDMEINHHNGHLRTKVFHKNPYEPYCLPYFSGYSSFEYRSIIRASILRAIRSCQDVNDFEHELKFMQLSFFFNQVPWIEIQRYIHLFDQEFQLQTQRYRYCQSEYNELRQRIRSYDEHFQKILTHHDTTMLSQNSSYVLIHNLTLDMSSKKTVKRPNDESDVHQRKNTPPSMTTTTKTTTMTTNILPKRMKSTHSFTSM
ncbi:unnamed protein product [Adineta ricciae]|uniref:Uncharacterized protein n=1 Tax=Adineta ricciae TaxID=249248 RepID=A0A814R9N2_ADIRI|nr:unnamed protein product [Adineta ricciae]CAF1485239.1 unnamed protein product [Adineta ricciae]